MNDEIVVVVVNKPEVSEEERKKQEEQLLQLQLEEHDFAEAFKHDLPDWMERD